MRRRTRGAAMGDDGGLDLTSLLNVLFILVFFFILTTNGNSGTRGLLDVRLSHPGAGAAGEGAKLHEVGVAKDGSMTLNGRAVTDDELLASLTKLVAEEKTDRVAVITDPEASVQATINAMDVIRKAGIERVTQRVSSKQ